MANGPAKVRMNTLSFINGISFYLTIVQLKIVAASCLQLPDCCIICLIQLFFSKIQQKSRYCLIHCPALKLQNKISL